MKKKVWYILAIILIVIIATSVYFTNKSKASSTDSQPTATVTRGDITMKVEGTGSLDADKSVITLKGNGIVKKVYYKEGDTVKKGALLYEIQDDSLNQQLSQAKANLDLAYNQLEYDTDNYNNSLAKQNVTSPADGTVESINVKVGQNIQPNTPIAVISDSSNPKNRYNVTSQISGSIKQINVTQGQTVKQGDLLALINGNISDLQIQNDKIKLQQAQSNYDQILNNIADLKIYSPIDGVIFSQNINVGDNLGNPIASNNSNASTQGNQNNNNTNGNGGSGSSNNGSGSQNTKVQTADITQLSNLSQQSETAVIVNTQNYYVNIPLDETDVNKIQPGQKATITTDDIPGEIFNGTVTKISKIPTVQNDVSSYNVTVSIGKNDKLRLGMTMNASILVSQSKNTLLLPLEAVQTNGNINYVILAGNNDNTGYNKNKRKIKRVQTGLSDNNYIEIKSGLNEGDKVVIPNAAGSSQFNFGQQDRQRSFPFMNRNISRSQRNGKNAKNNK